MSAGCDIQVSDDNGRTPLHDACSSAEPNFRLVEKLLNADKNLLFLVDIRGHSPLSNTRREHWPLWLQFIESRKNEYWPLRLGTDGTDSLNLITLMPHSRPVHDPKHALSLNICRMVSSGSLKPSDVEKLLFENNISGGITQIDSDDEDDDSNGEDGEDDDYFNTSNDTQSPSFNILLEDAVYQDSWNAAEMKIILESIDSPVKRPLVW
jgi:hypothetical protein